MPQVIEILNQYPEVLEAHFTTGNFALLLKVCTKTITDFHKFLIEKLQSIDEVQSTESFISMDQPIKKEISF